MHILLFDNKDSFTFNLVHYLEEQDVEVTVVRNDVPESEWPVAFDGIVISPGPGLPKESGNLMALIDRYFGELPILGVCLGHQALAEYDGAKLFNLSRIDHGVSRKLSHSGKAILFQGLPLEFEVGLYHSWAVDVSSLSEDWSQDAFCDDVLMAISHKKYPIFGVQFHPESILTKHGKEIITNFITFIKNKR